MTYHSPLYDTSTMNTLKTLIAATALALASFANAHEFKLGEIKIGHPYARATVAGQPGGAFLKLDNAGADDKLLSAQTELASRTELHSMAMEGDVMRMRQVDGIALPSGKTVELKPGGLHLMLFGLKAPLKSGDKFPLTLRFEKAGEVTVTVNVEAAGADHSTHH